MPLDLLTRLDPLRRVRCPFCFERFAAFEMHLRCDQSACATDYARMVDDPILSKALNGPGQGNTLRSPWWVDPRQDQRRGFRRHLDWFVLPGSLDCPNCGRGTDCRLCPRCHQSLPESVFKREAGHITIFGPQSVGKTTFMTVVLHEMDRRFGPERGVLLEPLNDEVRDRFRLEYQEVTYGSQHFGVGEDGEGSGRQPHFPTPPLETNRRVLQPLIYRVKRRAAGRSEPLLSFSDMAGEDWEMHFPTLKREAGHLIRDAKGLLFIIDPLRLPQVARDPRIRLTDKERLVPPADYREDISKLASFFHKTPAKVPLAICLNKLDRWGPLMAEETALFEVARSVPGKLKIDRKLDLLIHEEVRSALRKWDQLSFLEHLDIDLPEHRFFACSALGDAAQEHEDEPQPLPTPLLIERPLIWLLERQGILRGTRQP